jgi:hypothetical protein
MSTKILKTKEKLTYIITLVDMIDSGEKLKKVCDKGSELGLFVARKSFKYARRLLIADINNCLYELLCDGESAQEVQKIAKSMVIDLDRPTSGSNGVPTFLVNKYQEVKAKQEKPSTFNRKIVKASSIDALLEYFQTNTYAYLDLSGEVKLDYSTFVSMPIQLAMQKLKSGEIYIEYL